jgi:DNA invertase Pin-like site-specific DNA recombinase
VFAQQATVPAAEYVRMSTDHQKYSTQNQSNAIATNDEAYCYNKHVNRLVTVQEHMMIRRAIERGVPDCQGAQCRPAPHCA